VKRKNLKKNINDNSRKSRSRRRPKRRHSVMLTTKKNKSRYSAGRTSSNMNFKKIHCRRFWRRTKFSLEKN
jgi:hypothetical protein